MTRQFRYVSAALSLLTAACSQYPVIQSVDDGGVVIKASPDMFLQAIDLANNTCQESERDIEYVPGASQDLSLVSFNCVEPQSGIEVVE